MAVAMDYNEVNSIMANRGLASEPAFVNTNLLIEPTPNLDGCPLGVYFPSPEVIGGKYYPGNTIVVPSDGTEATVLHELGHRYGHYYNGDLSETAAEKFRARHQHGIALLYSGGDFSRFPKFSKLFEEGEKGAVGIAFPRPLSQSDIDAFQARFYGFGEQVPVLFYSPEPTPSIGLDFTKGIDWLMIINAGLAGLAAAGLGAIAYSMYKMTTEAPWVFPLVVFGSIAAAILAGQYITRHKPELAKRLRLA